MAAVMEMTTNEKVAVLLASLSKETAAAVLQQLDPDTMARAAGAIRDLGAVSGDAREKAIADCAKGITAMSNTAYGGEQTVNSLLTQAIGEKRATAMLENKTPARHAAFANLEGIPAEQISAALAREQPAVIAIVLRHLSPERAAEVLAAVPSELRKRAVVFMCTSNPPAPGVIAHIEKHIESQVGGGEKRQKIEQTDKIETLTNIIQQVDRSIEEELMAAIDAESEAVGNNIRDRLFTFEDIVNLSDVAIRRILQEIDMSLLSIALRGVSIALRQKFFKNMSKRAAQGLKEDMEFSQKQKASDVQAKQKEIVDTIRALDGEGQISISEGGEDELV